MTSYENLKLLIDYFGVTGRDIAQTLDIDPSIISRYATGKRRLLAASSHAEALAEYFLSKGSRVADMDWLKERFREAGLPTESSSVYRTKQNIIMLIASDGDDLRRNLAADPATVLAGETRPRENGNTVLPEQNGAVSIGTLSIVLALTPLLGAAPHGGTVDIFLSSDRLSTIVDDDIAALLRRSAEQNDQTIRIVTCVSGDTHAMSRLLDVYMRPLISGHVKLSVVHGMTQTITSTIHILISSTCAMLVTETMGTDAPPIATVVSNRAFVREMQDNFSTAFRYAQPILNIYDDNYSRNILEILYLEFCTPGALDIIKDSVNPMYMSTDAYDRFLQTRGHSPEEYAWRSNEFKRFKSGMDAVLQSGSVYREILSLPRLNDIARTGRCPMAGLYFMERGYIDLDAAGCLAVLNGYVEYLDRFPNFQILILDELSELHQNNCWHLKQNQSLGINNWQGEEPVMVHSDQLILLREFQERFDETWAKGAGAVGRRANVISILRDAAGHTKTKEK